MMRTGPRAALVRAATEMQFTLLPDFGVRTAKTNLFNIALCSAKTQTYIRLAWNDLVTQRMFTLLRRPCRVNPKTCCFYVLGFCSPRRLSSLCRVEGLVKQGLDRSWLRLRAQQTKAAVAESLAGFAFADA